MYQYILKIILKKIPNKIRKLEKKYQIEISRCSYTGYHYFKKVRVIVFFLYGEMQTITIFYGDSNLSINKESNVFKISNVTSPNEDIRKLYWLKDELDKT